jgi:hypothetical protein
MLSRQDEDAAGAYSRLLGLLNTNAAWAGNNFGGALKDLKPSSKPSSNALKSAPRGGAQQQISVRHENGEAATQGHP